MAGSAKRQLPRGCAWPCLVIGVLLALLGLGSVLGLPRCWLRSREIWTETPGSVAESYLKEGKREFKDGNMLDSRPSERTWDVRLKYHYGVNGRDFAGDAKALRQPSQDNRWYEAKAVMESYHVGDALPVFYNPAKPSVSRLTLKEPGIEFGKDVFSTLMFLLLGTGALFLGRKILRAYQPTAPS